MAKSRLKEYKGANFSWFFVNHPTAIEARELGQKFKFEEVDLKDVLPPIQRPKLIERDDYLFMILLFPVYNRESGRIKPVEVDFFIGKNFLVTTTSDDLFPIRDLFAHCGNKSDKELQAICANDNPAELIYEILSRLEQYCFPISTHINNDVDKVENEVFGATNKQDTINEVLRIKTNIVNFRKAMNRHTQVIKKFLDKAPRFFSTAKLDIYFKDLVDRSEDLWMMLENYQDTIDAIHDSHLSLLNYRSNVIMTVFTIFTAVIFTIELLISIIGLATEMLPWDTRPIGLTIASTGIVFTALVMVLFFKRKKWM
jgi:magnesium transporter